MKDSRLEWTVGCFLLIGFLCLGYLSIRLARNEFFGTGGFQVHALFSNCGGLKAGASVQIAGVEVGRVRSIGLKDYQADVTLVLRPGIQLQEDTIASVKTKGLIGEKYIDLAPGASAQLIANGGQIRDTEPAMDLESLVAKFVQGKL